MWDDLFHRHGDCTWDYFFHGAATAVGMTSSTGMAIITPPSSDLAGRYRFLSLSQTTYPSSMLPSAGINASRIAMSSGL